MKKLSTMLIALLAIVTMSANTFTKVTSAPDDWSGQYLVVFEKSATEAWIFNGKDAAQDYVTATIVDGKIVSDDLDQYAVTVEAMSGGYSIKVGAQYMGGDASKNIIKFNAQPILNTISMDSVVYFTSNTSVLRFNSTSTISDDKETGLRFRYYKAATYTKQRGFQLYKGTVEPIITEIDTVSVTEARANIDAGKLDACYIRGIVATAPSDPGSYGNTIFWMTDIENPNDSLEGYKISGLNGADIPTIDDIPFGLGDTIMIFANALKLYNNSIYETESGYFFRMIGKSSVINANSIFKFGVGARQWGAAYDGERYKYELVLAKTEENYEDALHMIINTAKGKGIAGSYQVRNYPGDSSYVDGEGPVEGSVMIQFVEDADATYNKYNVKADFTLNEQIYRIDTAFSLAGYDFDYTEQFKLSDDVPYVPQEGDTITCAQAKEYALNALGDNETSKMNVFIIGYANNAGKVSENQQTFYLDDQVAGTAKIVQSYWGNLTNMKQVTNGAKVLLHGKLLHYVNGSNHVAEIKNGDVVVLEGGEPLERDITLEPVPEGALTVAEAKALADQLAATDTSDVVIVMGYVTSLYNSYNTKYKSQSFYMNDVNDPASKSYFEAFQCGLEAPTIVGDFVWVEGRLTKFVKEGGDVNYNLVNGKGHFAALSTDLAKVLQTLPQDKVRKVFLDGRIYIVHKGAIYNLQGTVIKK